VEKSSTFTSTIFLPVEEFEVFAKKFPIGTQQNQQNPQSFLRVILGAEDADFFVCGLRKNGAEFLAYGFSDNIDMFPLDTVMESVMSQFYYLNISSLSEVDCIQVFESVLLLDQARKMISSRKQKRS